MKHHRLPLFVFIFLFLAPSGLLAQKFFPLQWQKCLGGTNVERANSLIRTSDGGYAIAGYTLSNDSDVVGNHGNSDAWVAKLDGLGVIQWAQCYGGASNEHANAIIQTSDGGFAFAGMNTGVIWVVKLDADGKITWQKLLGANGVGGANSIIQIPGGGYMIIGVSSAQVSGNHGADDVWVAELDAMGTVTWQKSYGGSFADSGSSIIRTADGGYIFTAHTLSDNADISGRHVGIDIWVVKIGSWGAIEWQKCLGGNGEEVSGSYIVSTDDGGYMIAGSTNSANNGQVSGNHNTLTYDIWLAKLTNVGELEWQKCLGGSANDFVRSLIRTSDGGYAIAGLTNSRDGDVLGNYGNDAWIVKLGSTGNFESQRCVGGSDFDEFTSLVQTPDGAYAAAGYTRSTDDDVFGNHGSDDMWIVKLSSVTGISNSSSIIEKLSLAAYPNPAVNSITVGYDIPKTAEVHITITDITGRSIEEHQVQAEIGHNETMFDVSKYSEGTYFIRVATSDASATRAVRVVR